jgi:hypothetical protein
VKSYLGEQLSNPAADLDEVEPQGVQLHPPHARPDQPPPQLVQQPLSRGVQQQPKLVCKEPVAAEAIGLQRPLEVLDPAFRFSPSHVPIVEFGRPIGTGAYDEAGVLALL